MSAAIRTILKNKNRLTKEAQTKSAGMKFDTGKPPMELLDAEWIEATAMVLEHGRIKYEANNWRKGIQVSRIIGGILRHLFAILRGEDIDPESGLPHSAHASCGCMFLHWMVKHKPEMDDRWKDEKRRPIT